MSTRVSQPSSPISLLGSSTFSRNSLLSIAQQRQRIRFQKSSPYHGRRGFDNISVGLDFSLSSHVKSLTSTTNPFVKHCFKLRHSSSYRHSHGMVLVVGSTTIREICRYWETLQGTTVGIDCLLLLDKAEIPDGLDVISVRIIRVSSQVMQKLSGLESIDSIESIALMKVPTSFSCADVKADCKTWFHFPHRVLVLDGIQDPGNLGTLLRSAMAFRWGGVFLLPGCCDPFNEKALRASRGASFQLRMVSGSWNDLEALKNEFHMRMLAGHPHNNDETRKVSSLSQGLAKSLADVPLCLILGSEGHGLSEKSQQKCELVVIPMAGESESLNVSVAGGIFLYMLQASNQKIRQYLL